MHIMCTQERKKGLGARLKLAISVVIIGSTCDQKVGVSKPNVSKI